MKKMPIIFIGHGSPINAIESNKYTESWSDIGKNLEKPRAILIFSSHWITEGETRISTSEKPEMIYDMVGFPPELYRVRYDAPGSPEIAEEICSVISRVPFSHADAGRISSVVQNELNPADSSLYLEGQKSTKIIPDPIRGFDHGVWSTLVHLFPAADVPVISMSLDYRATPESLFHLGEQLRVLRESGILIIGSGNIVHNLGAIDWSGEKAHNWAVEFDARFASGLKSGKNSPEWMSLLDFQSWGDISHLAHPSYDHLLPLFPLMGASSTTDRVEFYTPDIAMGSLSMRSVVWR
ncbi:dioxygenase [Candidatus Gracilibacteria bacterium]|nr:dioxygenase [Candidatus Gracilibacteria bacterium]